MIILHFHNRPQHEALGNNYRVCGGYSPEPRAEVYCVRLNFNLSKLVYSGAKTSRSVIFRRTKYQSFKKVCT